MARKKKDIPILGNENLYESFGVVPEKRVSFGKELEKNLVKKDMQAVLQEKARVDKMVLSEREMLRAYPPPQDELDLHGKTGAEAERETVRFIGTTTSLRLRTVRIITGKGLHSEGPAVLPDVVETKLKELKAENRILAFVWEKKAKHRSGAVIVYLL